MIFFAKFYFPIYKDKRNITKKRNAAFIRVLRNDFSLVLEFAQDIRQLSIVRLFAIDRLKGLGIKIFYIYLNKT